MRPKPSGHSLVPLSICILQVTRSQVSPGLYTAHQVDQLLSWTSCLASCTKGLELDSGQEPEAEKGISSINF
ncbi:hypothetical protein B0H17DRAFT_1048237 [Mycena rosella]|uniref:Uncharacterized protein n=1 Tax=Mycena rosella TaxID=1033263 RepID=A0AAD7DUE1_MYCRO|nr:hypothetical protein B0H17DRAFT_1048237 [Mycena rosella]